MKSLKRNSQILHVDYNQQLRYVLNNMENYLISPEDCLVVRAIHQSSSLREAATLLSCDPGGLFRKVKRIAENHDLLCKLDGKWSLTPKGHGLLAWTEESIQSQKLAIEAKSNLRIATTTWFGEQVVIPNLAILKSSVPGLAQMSVSVPDGSFEDALKSGSVDIAVVCHAPYDPSVAYKKIADEQWVTVVPAKYQKQITNKTEKEVGEFLNSKTFIHHNKLNPNAVLSVEFHNPTFTLDNLVGVRAAVVNDIGWSVVPRILVSEALKAKQVIEVKQLKPTIQNQVCIWWLRDRQDLKKTVAIFDQRLKESLS